MFVELIDRLRCPNDHADTWLVVASSRTINRDLRDATFGCPDCGAEYMMRDGTLWFGDPVVTVPMTVTEDETMRAAALLKLEERGLFLLDAGWGAFAPSLSQLLDVDLLLADPPAEWSGRGEGIVRGVGARWPLAASSVHGVALGEVTSARAVDAVRILRSGGRCVAPVHTPLPAGLRELARDDRHWVAEKVGDVIPLTRTRRAP